MEKTIGKRIAENRRRLGLTQDQLAEKLGVTAQAVSKWENDLSCPDIGTLPALAAIFGITTDELLGKDSGEKVYPAELATTETPGKESGVWEFQYNAEKKTSIFVALWVLLTGGLLLAAKLLHLNCGFWDLVWPSGILLFGLIGLFPRFSFFRLGCTLFGGYFLLKNLTLPVPSLWNLALPIFLVLFGLSLLLDALRKPRKSRFSMSHNGINSNYEVDGTRFTCDQSFGEKHQRVDLPQLSGGKLSLRFGEMTLDLSGCGSIDDGCQLETSCSFGDMTIYIPRKYRAVLQVNPAFANADLIGQPDPDASATIYITGSVSFGEIIVKYI